jgi:hypothetical protein
MMGDPINYFVLGLLGVMTAAFAIGFLLFQFRWSVGWCLVLAETAILVDWFAGGGYPNVWLVVFHVVALPVLLTPLLAGYYFNKFVIVHEGG